MVRSALLCLALGSTLARAQQLDAYRYDVVMRTRMPAMFGAAPASPDTIVVGTAISAGRLSRIDYGAGQMSSGPVARHPGDYMLVDSTVVKVVSPSQKTVTVMDPAQMASSMGDMFAMMPMGVSVSISDDTLRVDSLGAGERIQGLPTTRWRTYLTYRLNMTMGGQSFAMAQRHTTDYWLTTAIDALVNPAIPLVAADSVPKGPFEQLMRLSMEAIRRVPSGFPLRSQTTIVMENPMSGTTEAGATSEITNLRKERVDAAMFRVPAGYKVQSFADMMRQSMDSLRAGRVPPPRMPESPRPPA